MGPWISHYQQMSLDLSPWWLTKFYEVEAECIVSWFKWGLWSHRLGHLNTGSPVGGSVWGRFKKCSLVKGNRSQEDFESLKPGYSSSSFSTSWLHLKMRALSFPFQLPCLLPAAMLAHREPTHHDGLYPPRTVNQNTLSSISYFLSWYFIKATKSD